jgi:hypothetical protein
LPKSACFHRFLVKITPVIAVFSGGGKVFLLTVSPGVVIYK